MEKTIEIPFGAKDSELKGWEYTIPEGYKAEIKDGKVIVKRKENEDEIHRKWILEYLYDGLRKADEQFKDHFKAAIDWFEKQKDEAQKQFNLGIQAGKEEVMYEMKPFPAEDEKDFLEKEVKAFLCNYDKEFDDDAPTYDIAEHFYQLGKNSQKPAEWSEEEKMHLANAILAAEKEWGIDSCTANFLKSLRPHWKPSEEQMEELEYGIGLLGNMNVANALRELYSDLKKL